MLLYGPSYAVVPVMVGSATLYVDVNDEVTAAEDLSAFIAGPDVNTSVVDAVDIAEGGGAAPTIWVELPDPLALDVSDSLSALDVPTALIVEDIFASVSDSVTVGELLGMSIPQGDPTISVFDSVALAESVAGQIADMLVNVNDAPAVAEAIAWALGDFEPNKYDYVYTEELTQAIIELAGVSVADATAVAEAVTLFIYAPAAAFEIDVYESVGVGEAAGIFYGGTSTCITYNKLDAQWEFYVNDVLVGTMPQTIVTVPTVRYTSITNMPDYDHVAFGNTVGGDFYLVLPSGVDGRTIRVINSGGVGNTLTLYPFGSEVLFKVSGGSEAIADNESIEVTYNPTDGWA